MIHFFMEIPLYKYDKNYNKHPDHDIVEIRNY